MSFTNLNFQNQKHTGEIIYSNRADHGLKYNFASYSSDGKTTENNYISTGSLSSKELPSAMHSLKSNLCPKDHNIISINSSPLNLGEIKAWDAIANHATTKVFDSCGAEVANFNSISDIKPEFIQNLGQYSSESIFCSSIEDPIPLMLSVRVFESIDTNNKPVVSPKNLSTVFDITPNLHCASGNKINTLHNQNGDLIATYKNNDSDSITYKDILTPEYQGSITVLTQCE